MVMAQSRKAFAPYAKRLMKSIKSLIVKINQSESELIVLAHQPSKVYAKLSAIYMFSLNI